MSNTDTSPKSAGETPAAAEGIGSALLGALASARQALENFAELITFEIRRAGLTLMGMAALGAIAAILFVFAWCSLMAAFALWLVSLSLTWAGAIALVALVNFLAAGAAIGAGIVLSRNLLFPATRRRLKARSSPPSTNR